MRLFQFVCSTTFANYPIIYFITQFSVTQLNWLTCHHRFLLAVCYAHLISKYLQWFIYWVCSCPVFFLYFYSFVFFCWFFFCCLFVLLLFSSILSLFFCLFLSVFLFYFISNAFNWHLVMNWQCGNITATILTTSKNEQMSLSWKENWLFLR